MTKISPVIENVANWTSRTASCRACVDRLGLHAIRSSLVLVLLWIGGMKFTAYEAQGISIFVSNSPAMSWMYRLFSVQTVSNLLGASEIAIACLIGARFASARATVLGSALAVAMFATTLSFLLTTPGVWESSAGGFPALSVVPGQFLVKDFALLGASIWSLGESLSASKLEFPRNCGRFVSDLCR